MRGMWLSRQELVLRVHWMPPYVSDDFVEETFEEYGTVMQVRREEITVGDIVVETGLRKVTIVMTDAKMRELPHMMKFGDGHAILIVCPGRTPTCLGCGQEGHVRAYYGFPARIEKERSWAGVDRICVDVS